MRPSAQPKSEVLVVSTPPLPERPRILLLKLDHIGDLVLAMPGSAVRKAWPDGRVTLVCGPWNVELARQLGYVRRIEYYHFFQRPGTARAAASMVLLPSQL